SEVSGNACVLTGGLGGPGLQVVRVTNSCNGIQPEDGAAVYVNEIGPLGGQARQACNLGSGVYAALLPTRPDPSNIDQRVKGALDALEPTCQFLEQSQPPGNPKSELSEEICAGISALIAAGTEGIAAAAAEVIETSCITAGIGLKTLEQICKSSSSVISA